MSYIIQTTSGQTLTEIVDGNIDQKSTDLTLIGKNSSTYGAFINENFVYLLENFANISSPNQPIIGQLWYDTSEGRLKVYDGNGFKITSGTIVSPTVPDSLGQGDIWIDSLRRQMFFYDGTGLSLAGPQYTAQQGITGFDITNVTDINGLNHTIVLLYVAQVLIGIFSKERFRPQTPIDGFSTEEDPKYIEIGFNTGNYAGIKFDTTVTSAESLIDNTGAVRYAEDFVSTTTESVSLFGTTYLKNSRPLVLGTGQNNEINISNTEFALTSNSSNQNIKIATLPNGVANTNIFIDGTNQYVGINTEIPSADLEVNGDVVIQGNLTVNGTSTIINSTTLTVDDKNIVLADGAANNAAADGAGVTIYSGDGNKTFNWVNSTSSWTSSENIDIASSKTYKINGTTVLTNNTLGSEVTSSSLTSLGTVLDLNVGHLNITEYTISAYAGGSIILSPGSSGNVGVSSKRIVSLAPAVDGTDAVNLDQLRDELKTTSLGLTIDFTAISDPRANDIPNYITNQVLGNMFPTTEHNSGVKCRVFCILTVGLPVVKTFKVDNDLLWVYDPTLDITP